MNIQDLQATLRDFAAERDWQPVHTPKNLSTALMVEAAELAEIFQWMTPQESRGAHLDPVLKQRIGDEVADVLLYLLQVADHTQIDVAQAVSDKLARNTQKYPAKKTIARVSPVEEAPSDTHILLDYENVQPTELELQALVPQATKVWVFHGPHQKQVEQRFMSFGTGMTAVPISKTGKNALDFHLSFYMGYIASRNERAKIVVVANDRGYEPMLEHAKAMGFAVRQQSHVRAKPGADKAVSGVTSGTTAKKAPAKKTAAKTTVAPKPGGAKKTAAKKAAAKPAKPTAAKKASKVAKPKKGAVPEPVGSHQPKAGRPSPDSPAMLRKMTESLRKMEEQRPRKQSSLRRALKPLLGNGVSEASIEVALGKLIEQGVVAVAPSGAVTYPKFAADTKADPITS
jgi:NTP pyrophosphatase (non-canonical NTP hydrolase)